MTDLKFTKTSESDVGWNCGISDRCMENAKKKIF